MWVIVVLLATLSGSPVGLGEYTLVKYDTKEACDAARPAVVDRMNEQLQAAGGMVKSSVCAPEAEVAKYRKTKPDDSI